MTLKECYRILKLKEGASVDDVKSAYRKRAFELHPDLHPDKPDAARQFQLLNEAYVMLTRTGSTEEGFRTQAEQAYAKAKKGFDASQSSQSSQSSQAGQSAQSSQEQRTRASEAYSKTQSQKAGGSATGARYTSSRQQVRQEDVLNDILKDPFARRVFEDIYSQIRRETGKAPLPRKRKLSFEWGDSKLSFDMTHGLAAGVKGWMRKQMDDEQTIHLPPQSLVPGARVRITLSQGMNEEPRQIEITLPSDFVVGRPIRLKGLGRKIGPWVGDLYLRILAKLS
ncbi:J domain-containing protein [Desulfovibrio mangrovi]|uniref:J domain-containing protein n=1 Tax=Desulfovibrio mangrovi TaxID=2976983 RepID=UPI002246DC33|nr:J domain-containing protein [Desulfovibrio mangrovi]UZP67464.1 J domain-containing protein [Desulfovibrio mangrovi]